MTTTAVIEASPTAVPIRFGTEQSQEAELTTSIDQSPPSASTDEYQEKELVVTPIHTYLYNMIELGIVRTLFDCHAFEAIPTEGDISIEDLAGKTGVEVALLNRFIQFLILAKCLASPAPGRVAHTQKSRVF